MEKPIVTQSAADINEENSSLFVFVRGLTIYDEKREPSELKTIRAKIIKEFEV
jgi:hypothetical protein